MARGTPISTLVLVGLLIFGALIVFRAFGGGSGGGGFVETITDLVKTVFEPFTPTPPTTNGNGGATTPPFYPSAFSQAVGGTGFFASLGISEALARKIPSYPDASKRRFAAAVTRAGIRGGGLYGATTFFPLLTRLPEAHALPLVATLIGAPSEVPQGGATGSEPYLV